MSVILAALDDTAAARPVLETAVRCGELLAIEVEALHVCRDHAISHEALTSLTERVGVPLEVVDGPVVPTVLTSLAEATVVAGVIGARALAEGRRPVGHVAGSILEGVTKPIVVVPPDSAPTRPFRRLLVPLEGTPESSLPVADWLLPRLPADIELVVLHSFTDATRPSMLDRPEYDWALLGKEFAARHLPRATQTQLRPGPAATRIGEAARALDTDLVVMSWRQDPSPGRARTLRAVLSASSQPVLLLPSPTGRARPPVTNA